MSVVAGRASFERRRQSHHPPGHFSVQEQLAERARGLRRMALPDNNGGDTAQMGGGGTRMNCLTPGSGVRVEEGPSPRLFSAS